MISRVEAGSQLHLEVVPGELEVVFGPNYEMQIYRYLIQGGFYKAENLPRLLRHLNPHEKSQAAYLLEHDAGDTITYVQYMRPGHKTSRHKHDLPVTEDYLIIRGEYFINGVLIPPRVIHTVGSNIFHQSETRGSHALAILRTNNVRGVPRNQLHIHE